MPYPCLILCSLQIPRRFHADVYAECDAESLRNLSMPNPFLILCSIQISSRFHADFHAESMQNLCGICLCLIHSFLYAACRFQADFTQTFMRNPCQSTRNLSLPNPCFILCSIQILGKFHADFKQTFMRNTCKIYLFLLYALFHAARRFQGNVTQTYIPITCGIYSCLILAWFHAACRLLANYTQISRRLYVLLFYLTESMRKPFGIYLCPILSWLHAACTYYVDFTQLSRQISRTVLYGMHVESIIALSMLDYMQHVDITQTSMRKPCGIYVESMRNLFRPNPCFIPCSMQISWTF